MTRKTLFPTLLLALALVVPVGAQDDTRVPPPSARTAEPFVAVGVLDLVTHREGTTVFGIGLKSGRIEVTCTARLGRLGSADACDALAERLLGAFILVRGREILVNGEHVAFRSSDFQRVN